MTARSSVTQGQPAIHTGELSSERLRRPPRDCQLLAAGSTMNTNTQQYERYKHTKQDATKTWRNLYQNAHWLTCFAHFNFLRHCLAQTLSRWCAGFQCRLPCCRTAWPGLFSDSSFFLGNCKFQITPWWWWWRLAHVFVYNLSFGLIRGAPPAQ